jgi:methionyl-tRNA synthetase
METVNNNNAIIVSENNMIIVQHSTAEVIDTDKCKRFYSSNTGKYLYKPLYPNYYNDYCHKHKKEITCDICGKTMLKKIIQHQKSNTCILTHFIQQAELQRNGT